MKRIIIIMDGGLIQDIQNIPDGVIIEVHDYDIEGTQEELHESNDGEYVKSEWSN